LTLFLARVELEKMCSFPTAYGQIEQELNRAYNKKEGARL
jgi:hypothetical protein